jgi:hypothetical protein
MRRVVTLGAAALAFALALCTPAHAQQVETRVFDYEWLVIRLPQFMTNFEFGGLIFIQEVASAGRPNRGLFEGSLTVNGGPKQFDCVNATIASGADILQVGPLAQQATINGDAILDWIAAHTPSSCSPPPQSLSLVCPWGGLHFSRAPGYDTFTYNGTYRLPSNLGGTYKATGRRGPIICEVEVKGMVFHAAGWITRAREVRRGTDVSQATQLWWHEYGLTPISPELFVQ